MTALDLLPSDIILEILQHLIVYDLISVSQTCTELRALIRERRSILAGAPDSHIISLPFGSSLTNIDSNSLHFCAAQTISLLRRLRDSTVPCKKHLKLKLFHEFPVAYLHPIFLFDNTLVIVHVGGEISLFDLRTKQGLFNYTLPDEDIRLVDCQQSPDRSQVILAIMPSAVVSHYEDRRVDVYRFSFRLSESDEPLALTTHELFTIGLPHEASYERLFLHGPLIVIEGSERFLICNWEENTGTSVPFPENLDDEIGRTWLHREEDQLILFIDGETMLEIYTCRISELLLSTSHPWPDQFTKFQLVYRADILGNSIRTALGLRRSSSCWLFDILSSPIPTFRRELPQSSSHDSAPEPRVELQTLSVSDWSLMSPPKSLSYSSKDFYTFDFHDAYLSNSPPLCIHRTDPSPYGVSFLKLHDSPADPLTWTELSLPESLPRSSFELGFDRSGGRLLLMERDTMHILHY